MIFLCENVLDNMDEFLALARENGREVYGSEYNPDIPLIVLMAQRQSGLYFTMRTDDNELVGYAVFLTAPLMHRKQFLSAECNTIYISAKHRGAHARRFIKYLDMELQRLGFKRISYTVPNTPAHIRLFKALGYEPSEIVLTKEI